MAAATEPTRRPWHSGTDAIWADSAAAGDAESAPSDGEKIAGHVNNTGYTSGRANWLWAAAAEWLQKVRDVLLPQHTDAGGHWNVGVTGTIGAAKLTINCDTTASGEADNTPVFVVSNPDSSYDAAITKRGDGQFIKAEIGSRLNGVVGGDSKVLIRATSGDANTDLQLEIRDQSGATVLSVDAVGTITTGMPGYTLGLSPGEFAAYIRQGGQTDTATVWCINETTFDGSMNVADVNARYAACPEQRLQVGDSITAVTLHADRTAGGTGTITLQLLNKSAYGTTQLVGSATVNSGTNHQTATLSGLPHTVTDIKGYYWRISIENSSGGAANEVSFQFVDIAVTRTKVR